MRAIIATAVITFKQSARDSAFRIVLIVFAALIIFSTALAMFGLGRQAEMIREMGLSSLMLGGLVVALLSGAGTVIEERHNRTALSTLAKPISRKQLVAGKYCGIMLTTALALLVLFVVFGVVLANEEGLDALLGAENGVCQSPLLLEIGKAVLLIYFEIALISSIVVGLALFFSRLATVGISLAFFALGHLSGGILETCGIGQSRCALGLPGSLLPRLEFLRIATIVAERQSIVSPTYLLWAAVYTVCGIVATLAVAMFFFDRRQIY